MAKVYIETSIVSYLTARPSGNLIAAAWQKETLDWWETQRGRFSLYLSELVIEEAGKGDAEAARRRLDALSGITILSLNDAAVDLAQALIEGGGVPRKALDDALHISIAAVHGVDYLLTWNCRHIDNAEMKPRIRSICQAHGNQCPEIATPIELMGIANDG
ncbi:MAG: type II toxin-antitoxin system VapC family toxin [Gammaproteobacteria bacterium]|nr:type II toxin-antitoxin system VapC family toxin [Gammaproteobacteria bacterium]MBU1653710.1 type II toxin-antitoxin system VapC family toxin [Gammaproteobacteria bacterium]MBU1962530.1 type II toxin-antitoxin system VapC family toxin [Gammaproteobacteria bacterium]